MASYADIAKEHREPPAYQPHADPALLNTAPSSEKPELPSADSKVTVVKSDFKQHPEVASPPGPSAPEPPTSLSSVPPPPKTSTLTSMPDTQELKNKSQEKLGAAESKSEDIWQKTKKVVLRPEVGGGLVGLTNIAVLGGLGYKLYTEPGLRSDKQFLGLSAAGVIALFGVEGAVAEAYVKTDAGRAEADRIKREGSQLFTQTKEIVLRPGVAGGIVGVVNVGILGGLGYWSYLHWNEKWDEQKVAGTTAALLTLFGVQGYLGEQYREKELPKHK